MVKMMSFCIKRGPRTPVPPFQIVELPSLLMIATYVEARS